MLVESSGSTLQLADTVWVDAREVAALAHDLLQGGQISERLPTTLLALDLLPGWYDDWVIVEQERMRQLRLHALEELCSRLTSEGRYGEAIDAGLCCVSGDPLRESAHKKLILAHAAEGNRSEAIRQYERYREVLGRELGIEPSPDLKRLVDAPGGNGSDGPLDQSAHLS
jgi:DNA-binding SARP family transcriptional activator